MKKANVAEVKNRLSHYLDRVKKGETVLVLERTTPVARIVPIAAPSEMSNDEREVWLRRAAETGTVRLGARKGVLGVLTRTPAAERRVGAVKTLVEERRRR
jgi:prevent-host-death family protein